MRNLKSICAFVVGGGVIGAAAGAFAQVPGVLANVNVAQPPSKLSWFLDSLGLFGLLALLMGAAIFVGACLVVTKTRRPQVIAAYLVFLPLPVLFAIIGALKGCVASFSVIALSGIEIDRAAWYSGMTELLLTPLMTLLITMPSYLVIAIGLFLRTIAAGEQPTSRGRKTDSPPVGAGSVKMPDAA